MVPLSTPIVGMWHSNRLGDWRSGFRARQSRKAMCKGTSRESIAADPLFRRGPRLRAIAVFYASCVFELAGAQHITIGHADRYVLDSKPARDLVASHIFFRIGRHRP